ncbi:MAG TPA: dimethylmenaquinone methyltransferase [Chloroflexi bacterium]|nr:dimethylmenaquinone methyltransferase [Chloroflexota bacterium]
MDDLLVKLAAFDTPTICNCIELFEVRPRNVGYMDARIKACFPEMPPMVGYAATATMRCSVPPRHGDVYASTVSQVERFGELSGSPVLVFQDLDDPPQAAVFGEIMCTTYQAFGAIGLITNGGGRDLAQVRALNFPVFTSRSICSHAYSTVLHIHTPVHVGGMVIYPDDLMHGDCNGVTTIPHEIVVELADVGAEYVAAEAIILNALREGTATVQRLREARAAADAKMTELRDRVSRRRRSGG